MCKKNIIINEKKYVLELKKIGEPGFSGTVYRLKQDDLDLAVKIYHEDLPTDVPLYPTKEELIYFTKNANETFPILLSQYLVEDLNHNYIGCACPFIEETRGNTEDAIFNLPKDFIFEYLFRIHDTLPLFNKRKIEMDDLNISNIILGSNETLPEALYVFDDSNYSVTKKITDNSQVFNNLIEDIVDTFCEDNIDKRVSNILSREMKLRENYLDFLVEHSKDCKNVGEIISCESKVLKKKYL